MSTVDFSHAGHTVEHVSSGAESPAEGVLIQVGATNTPNAAVTDMQWNDVRAAQSGEVTVA